jgi:hypothetical protein
MPPTPPRLRKLARRLLTLESASGKAAAGNGSAAFRVNEKLRRPISTLAGVAGFRSLLSRALALAGDEVRWLKAVHVSAAGSLEAMEKIRTQLSPEDIARGEEVLIGRLVGLLITFIGEGLTLRVLQEAWPAVSARDLNSGTEKDHG